MQNKKGNSMPINIVIYVVIGLILLAVLVYMIMNNFAPTATKLFEECGTLSAGVWTTERCDTKVSMESKIVERIMYNDELHYCCVAIPGKEAKFEERYANDLLNDLNKYGTTGKPKDVSNTGSSNTGSGSTTNNEIRFILDGKEIPQATTNTYTSNFRAQGTTYSGDLQSYVIEQDLPGTLGECRIEVQPAILVDENGEKKLKQQNSAGPGKEVIVIQKECQRSIGNSSAQLQALTAEPGLYKWDFSYKTRGVDGDAASYTAYIKIINGPSPTGGNTGTGSATGEYELTFFDEAYSRNNHRTCILTATLRDKGNGEKQPLTGALYFDIKNDGTQPLEPLTKEFKQGTYTLWQGQQLLIRYGPERQTGFEDYLLDFDDCDTIDYVDETTYQNNAASCMGSEYIYQCDYSRKSECGKPYDRGSSYCYETYDDCWWEKDFPVGDCRTCDNRIRTCSDYQEYRSCESNQCLGENGMNDRCYFYQGECKECRYDLTDPCTQHEEKADCKNDICQIKDYLGITCEWISGSCKTTNQ